MNRIQKISRCATGAGRRSNAFERFGGSRRRFAAKISRFGGNCRFSAANVPNSGGNPHCSAANVPNSGGNPRCSATNVARSGRGRRTFGVCRAPVASGLGRRLVALSTALLAWLAMPAGAQASGLLVSTVGPGANATNGAAVAEPIAPPDALLANPAGLARFTQSTIATSFGIGYGQEQIRAEGNPAYTPERSAITLIPDFGAAIRTGDRTVFGFGVSGSVGSNYNFNPEPDAGVPADFYSETSVINLPLGLAYEVSEHLWLGAEVAPLIGYFRAHYPTPVIPVRFTMRGPGIQGAVGATWRPNDGWAVGLGMRSPGMIWMRGSMASLGPERQDVDLDLKIPAQIVLGVTRHVTQRLSVSVSGRWTDSSSLGRSTVKFSSTPQVNTPFVPDALDEWRGAIGVQFRVRENLEWRAGFGHATRIVGNRGLSPLLFDSQDERLGTGFAWTRGTWTIEGMVGYWFLRSRYVSGANALIIPGRYRFGGGGIVSLGVQHRI